MVSDGGVGEGWSGGWLMCVVLRLVNNTQAPPCGPMSSITNPARSGLRVRSASVPTTVHLHAR